MFLVDSLMMKIFSRRCLSRKLTWCRDLICHKSRALFTRKRYKSEEEEVGGGGGWPEELPDDVMQEIMQRLSLPDYLNCRDVSLSWRAAIDSKRWFPAAHHQLPWLVTGSLFGRHMLASYIKTDADDDDCLCSASHRSILNLKNNFSQSYGAGSIEGWLIISNRRRNVHIFFLWNPVSGARVKLPSHAHHGGVGEPLKVVASSVPTTTTCYVACLHFKRMGRLAFCTPTDRSWTKIEAENALKFWDIEILHDKLYALAGMERALEFMMVFDIHLQTHAYTLHRLVTLRPNFKNIVCETRLRTCYLAKCFESNELFVVLYQRPWIPLHQNSGFEFQVYKLEDDNAATNSLRWVEIADLGDRALFMGTHNSKFITCHNKTLEKNCIYGVLSEDAGGGYTSGVFSLTDKSFKPINLHKSHCNFSIDNYSIWFLPNPC